MNEKCKYCDYVSKCSRVCEYNSVMCRLHRSFPKIVDKSYEELQQRIDKAIRMLEINIEITSQQPSENKMEDEFILNRYKDLLSILKGEDKE